MFLRWAKLSVATALLWVPVCTRGDIPQYRDDFRNLDNWTVEQMPGGQVVAEGSRMIITDAKGCTVWFRTKLSAPLSIRYDALVRSSGRVSDLNCFWMASDPQHPGDLFASLKKRSGAFVDYDALRTYYVG